MGNVDSYVDDVCLFNCLLSAGGGGGIPWGGGLRRGDAAPYIYIYCFVLFLHLLHFAIFSVSFHIFVSLSFWLGEKGLVIRRMRCLDVCGTW